MLAESVGYALGAKWQNVANGFHGPTYAIAGIVVIALGVAVLLHLRRYSREPVAAFRVEPQAHGVATVGAVPGEDSGDLHELIAIAANKLEGHSS